MPRTLQALFLAVTGLVSSALPIHSGEAKPDSALPDHLYWSDTIVLKSCSSK
jgi:hypothetical protein